MSRRGCRENRFRRTPAAVVVVVVVSSRGALRVLLGMAACETPSAAAVEVVQSCVETLREGS